MRIRSLPIVILMLAVIALAAFAVMASPAAQADGPAFKHLAGPATDIATGVMALPDPAQLGLRSHSAMLPVQLEPTANGAFQWQARIPVDAAEGLSFVLLAPQAQNWRIDVQAPGMKTRPLEKITDLGVEKTASTFGYDGDTYPATVYKITNKAPRGIWRVTISAPAAGRGYLIVGADSPYRLYTHLANYNLSVGQHIGLVAYAYDKDAISGDAPEPLANVLRDVSARVKMPGGQEIIIKLSDDGRHNDGAAHDGVFGGDFVAPAAGAYQAQVLAQGVTPDGQPFLRTTQHIFPIIDAQAQLGVNATASVSDAVRLQIHIPVRGLAEGAVVQAYAEVWGVNAAGQPAPAAWIGGLSQVQDGQLALSFDTRWLGYAGVTGPLTLQQVRLQDNDTGIPLATRSRMTLRTPALPKAASQPVRGITQDMLMGQRPAMAPKAATSGGKLMLVHGYCSEGVWPTYDFTDYAVFQDYNQNRSHDEFARLIRDFGDQFSSFGVVAHSQGGDASLHLYTYYWSGLDYSSGDRLIQSVGTPYQGTALAGDLALLGEIFGAGCGYNWDLTYDGSALWLSGIPSWARGRVHYWTTSDEDVWWRWDYCSAATDIVLDDPEDGVVERWAGQLSGGNNHGHKEGWCHTNDMRDPAQYLDHGRNHEMNTYANR
jgi:hypothetical protein